MQNRPVIVFAKPSSERDFLRHVIFRFSNSILCFDKEETCLENLGSLQPQAIVARIDSPTIAWRFVITMHLLNSNAYLIIISNSLSQNDFDDCGFEVKLFFLRYSFEEVGLAKRIQEVMETPQPEPRCVEREAIIGGTPGAAKIRAVVRRLSNTDDPVLITGPRGTGKELFARMIAGRSDNGRVFIKIDCETAGSKEALECLPVGSNGSEESKGRPMSDGDRPAAGGSILFDRIHKLKRALQGRILALLDDGAASPFKKIGTSYQTVRVICTSETDLHDLVLRNRFRKDLYYRLSVIPVHTQPLRQRAKDLPLLLDYFLVKAFINRMSSFKFPSPRTMEIMCSYDWPGNLDELQEVIDRYVSTKDERSILKCIGGNVPNGRISDRFRSMYLMDLEFQPFDIQKSMTFLGHRSLKAICDSFASRTEERIMKRALESTNWNRKKAAALLNISYKSMLNKMKTYEIV